MGFLPLIRFLIVLSLGFLWFLYLGILNNDLFTETSWNIRSILFSILLFSSLTELKIVAILCSISDIFTLDNIPSKCSMIVPNVSGTLLSSNSSNKFTIPAFGKQRPSSLTIGFSLILNNKIDSARILNFHKSSLSSFCSPLIYKAIFSSISK